MATKRPLFDAGLDERELFLVAAVGADEQIDRLGDRCVAIGRGAIDREHDRLAGGQLR